MRGNADTLPLKQSMKRPHRVRRARPSNAEHGAKAYLGHKHKPWKHHNLRSTAA